MIMNDPFQLFNMWFRYAQTIYKNHSLTGNAAVVSTCNQNKRSSSRVVLLKNITPAGFTFYTNKNSKKGQDIKENPQASLLFYWELIQRQVRLEGTIKDVDESLSDQYFQSRAYLSKIGAWASQQSSIIKHPGDFQTAVEKMQKIYPQDPVPRPEYWGGFQFIPLYFEFWKEGSFRLHRRKIFSLQNGEWVKKFLYP